MLKASVSITGCALASMTAMLCCVVTLYAAAALAAAETLRHRLPVVGPLVADEIEGWLLGAETELVIDDINLSGTNPPEVAGIYTGTVEQKPECKRPSGWPTKGYFVRGFRPPSAPGHTGIDIGVPVGQPDVATMCGTVVFAGWSDIGYGNLVVVRNGEFDTFYAHNSSVVVHAGQQVARGQLLALTGSTGASTGPHVHYEVRLNGIPVDPLAFP